MIGTHREVVVVTGASAGVGRAIACAIARRGAQIGLLARGQAGLEAAQKEVEQLGGKALVLPTDVADPDQVEEAASKVEETFGPLDVWINVAMASVFSPVKEMKPEEYKRVTEVTYLGQVYGTLAALHRMLPRDRGRIIQVGSALAYRGIPLQSAYCGAKHAIQGFTESLRCELIHDHSHITITMVQLPVVNTPQFGWVKSRLPHKAQPVPPIYQPEVIADAVTWVTDHYRRQLFITVLIVEDDSDLGEALVQVLKEETPYQGILVPDGFAALLTVGRVQPDLFVLDYHLPEMDGIALIDHLRTIIGCEPTPIILMSANPPWAQIAQRQLLALPKPFELDTFLRRIKELLA
ncbi:MAG TPA: SDR family oxidoreductase [Ktedonobacteraceae bacterium]|nr:SDR family oxidoreductase [Ktedonobacteraceae bacterium]